LVSGSRALEQQNDLGSFDDGAWLLDCPQKAALGKAGKDTFTRMALDPRPHFPA